MTHLRCVGCGEILAAGRRPGRSASWYAFTTRPDGTGAMSDFCPGGLTAGRHVADTTDPAVVEEWLAS